MRRTTPRCHHHHHHHHHCHIAVSDIQGLLECLTLGEALRSPGVTEVGGASWLAWAHSSCSALRPRGSASNPGKATPRSNAPPLGLALSPAGPCLCPSHPVVSPCHAPTSSLSKELCTSRPTGRYRLRQKGPSDEHEDHGSWEDVVCVFSPC